MISLSYKQADPSYTVDSGTRVTFPGPTCFFFLWRLVRPSQSGERAGPLAKMLLGAKHGGRPRIVSRIIVEEYCRSLSVPNVFYSDVLSFRSIYRNLLHIFGYVTKVQSIDRVLISRVVASLRERGNRAAAYAVRYLHVWRRTAY